jgi:hypothetical protein
MPALLAPSDPPRSRSSSTSALSIEPSASRRAHVLGLIALAISGLLTSAHASWRARASRA